jgi:hypothetical protein
MSGPDPAGDGTTRRIAFEGKLCALASHGIDVMQAMAVNAVRLSHWFRFAFFDLRSVNMTMRLFRRQRLKGEIDLGQALIFCNELIEHLLLRLMNVFGVCLAQN